ncbi:hypothetical protein H1R20_g657, partial [Candolleomyces eurysporus]
MTSHSSDPLPAGSLVDEYPPPSTSATLRNETAQEELCSRPGASVDAVEEESAKQDEKYGFIAFLLGHSPDREETSTLIIDFNRSENIEGEARTEKHPHDRTVGV